MDAQKTGLAGVSFHLSGMRGVGPLLMGCQNGMKAFASLDAVCALMMTDETQRQEQLQKAASRTGSEAKRPSAYKELPWSVTP